ncbi:MAG: HIT family protein [Planctomycetaceae bacterium]|jgi:histidine triad (HIT) family protein
MPTLFTKIISGELPGRFVYRDDQVVAFLTIAPLKPGHTLVVPIAEYDHWINLPPELAAHTFAVAQKVAQAVQRAFQPTRVGLMIAGLEVPHVHLHITPIWELGDMSFARQQQNPDPAMMDDAMTTLRHELGWQPE